MRKNTFILIILLLGVNAFSYFTTEYAIVDSLSEEWQQAGIS
jgi:hypothetical protein